MKKLIVIALILLLGVGGYYYQKSKNKPESSSIQTAQQSQSEKKSEPEPESNPNVKTYTMEEVRKHGPENWDDESLGTNDACWMVIHDKVYAIPDSFTETHPGGHAIYDGCGTDATTLFETRPMGTGKPHSDNARAILEKYYIGDLKK